MDRGSYTDARTPWEDADWRAEALTWLDTQLAEVGVEETGPRRVRLRPWSVIVRVEAARPVWFKANPPGSAFEPALMARLAELVPEHVLTPYAVDVGRAWSLSPDGGGLLRDVERTAETWETLLSQYAELQRKLADHVDELIGLGVPDARLAKLPDIFDRAVTANQTLTAEQREVLHKLRPQLVDWCAELATFGIPDTLDHADLHENQVFACDRFTFFDWGDATVSHAFCSLLVPLQRIGTDHARLRDAYLAPWTDDGHALADLRRAAHLAWRLGPLGRAASWGRLFPGAYNTPIGDAGIAEALLGLLEPARI
ncbi:aminoglycoside phosphotransferase family protein [Kribbella sandramycini]|uniref:Aminoglycoside phosphotransferase family protein n=1 Tax=Kribbella sandramycini TaxID=60450 RepID=A0A7Y4L0L4_9ACTN|nr:aminoglycoside phosphotransferase family protein [Kribbella sandramycini]